jgi:hypothetical protein
MINKHRTIDSVKVGVDVEESKVESESIAFDQAPILLP